VCVTMGNRCFDVGANVGMIAIPLAHHLRNNGGGSIIAFEPVKPNFDRLKKTVSLNHLEDVVKTFNVALGDEEGEIEIALETQGGASTGNAVMSKIADDLSGFTVSKARITRLDTFVEEQDIDLVDFIKVDIEGAELLFLRGGQKFLAKSRPIIYGEFHSGMMPKFGHNFLDVIEFFKPLNYRVFGFKNRLQPAEILEPKVGMGNVFFVPEEKTEELLKRVEAARQSD
jgi:FkbM family methyltransferase